MSREWNDKLRIDGKLYRYHDWYHTRTEARNVARGLRRRGHLARVIPTKPGRRFLYRVYVR